MSDFKWESVRVIQTRGGYGRNAIKGDWQVQKKGGLIISCWHSVSGHYSFDAAEKAAKRLAKKLSVELLPWSHGGCDELS